MLRKQIIPTACLGGRREVKRDKAVWDISFHEVGSQGFASPLTCKKPRDSNVQDFQDMQRQQRGVLNSRPTSHRPDLRPRRFTMLAAFHRDLIAAPFLGSRRLVIRDGSTHVQNELREHAAKISASSSFHLSQKVHLDEHGHALVWSDDKTCAARQNRVCRTLNLRFACTSESILSFLALQKFLYLCSVMFTCALSLHRDRLPRLAFFECEDVLSVQVKVIFTGRLLNYEEICSLYYDCERMLRVHDPAQLLLHLYLQVLLCFWLKMLGDSTEVPCEF